ncbi:MAG TPA: helix-turn-helix transcriptional regulator [Acidimicrobiales bacterium]|nr:helix-turn-helix transcriptional regulator [Acidimicrobiales bacterium]
MHATESSLGEVWMQVRDHKKLARLAVIQELTHRDIAAACGWKAHSYVGRILRGDVKTVDPEAAVRIAHLFGVAVDDIFLTRSSKNPARRVRDSAA